MYLCALKLFFCLKSKFKVDQGWGKMSTAQILHLPRAGASFLWPKSLTINFLWAPIYQGLLLKAGLEVRQIDELYSMRFVVNGFYFWIFFISLSWVFEIKKMYLKNVALTTNLFGSKTTRFGHETWSPALPLLKQKLGRIWVFKIIKMH